MTFDQFETFLSTELSGTYTDNIMYLPRGATQATSRIYAGSVATGFPGFDQDQVNIAGFNGTTTTIPTAFTRVSASFYDVQKAYAEAGSQRRSIRFFSPNEEYFDSFMPDPVQCYLTGSIYTASVVTVFNRSLPQVNFGIISQSVLTLGYNLHSRSFSVSPAGAGVGNLAWANDFPFQSRYRGINRIYNYENAQIGENDNLHFNGAVISTNYTYGSITVVGSPAKLGLAYMGMYELQWDHFSVRNYSNGVTAYSNLIDSYTINDASEPYQPPAITKSMMTIADLNFVTSSGNTAWTRAMTPWQPPSNELFYKHFYSFGKFLGKFAAGFVTGTLGSGSVSTSAQYGVGEEDHYHAVRTGSMIGVLPTGWKYGVYHALPAQSNAVFRRGRFGQFRDMLEQRSFSKFIDRSSFTVTRPLEITFQSGSQAALTASAWWLNTRDSGIYDTEYKSGQPFYDIENID